MKTLLVATDFSASTDAVLQTAAALARALNARIVALHVLQPIVTMGDPMVDLTQIAAMQKSSEENAHKQLAQVCAQASELGAAAEPDFREGSASSVILERARALPADLIVMGSHGHTALYDLLLGSTSHAVLKKSPCPVVIVPSKK
jgi:nucleotide-binding universal stress UspA family protein